ncbi:hypothetical protein SAMN05421878_11346 [Actinobaculum suis]|uniref:Uncharacterized protein n=1 Tax=Actinobaculum suis TaxID=1657 RepID=A0A1G7DWI7_9ACTO|nr:hypothetical protein SAMN05421878_11346 [Actinobaculum suis]
MKKFGSIILSLVISAMLFPPWSKASAEERGDGTANRIAEHVIVPDPAVLNDPIAYYMEGRGGSRKEVSRMKRLPWHSCTAPPGVWVTCSDRIGHFGYHGKVMSFSWNVHWTSSSSATVQVQGFNSAGKAVWYGAGIGKSGSASVPWGNVLANKKVKVRSIHVPAGVTVQWQ